MAVEGATVEAADEVVTAAEEGATCRSARQAGATVVAVEVISPAAGVEETEVGVAAAAGVAGVAGSGQVESKALASFRK